MTVEPNDVLEEMCIAHMKSQLGKGLATPIENMKAALRAARELGYELKPRLRTVAMTDAYYEAGDDDELQWQNQYDAAPDILAEGE